MNKKIYKGYELIKAIADGEIKSGTKIEIIGRFQGDLMGSYFIYGESTFDFPIYKPDNTEYFDEIRLYDIISYDFKLIEEDKIDIDSIEELNYTGDGHADYTNVIPKINELVQAVNQLNKEIKELKEK